MMKDKYEKMFCHFNEYNGNVIAINILIVKTIFTSNYKQDLVECTKLQQTFMHQTKYS